MTVKTGIKNTKTYNKYFSTIFKYFKIHFKRLNFRHVVLTYFFLNLSSCEAGVLWCQSIPGCYVDGGWGQWGAWTNCSLPCGGGVMLRRRHCDNPSPQNGGRGCLGVVQQQKDCNTHLCKGSLLCLLSCQTVGCTSVLSVVHGVGIIVFSDIFFSFL